MDKLLTTAEVAELLGLSPRSVEDLRYRGVGPRFVRLSRRCIRYRPEAIAAWAKAREVASTSAPTRA